MATTTPPTGRLLPPSPPPPPPRRRLTPTPTPELDRLRTARWITIGIVIGLAVIVAGIVGGYFNFLTGLAAFGTMLLGFLAQGFRNFDPTTLAVPMFLGKLYNCTIGPGWQFIPLAGMIFDYEIIDARRINLELDVEERTPDSGLVKVEPFFSWRVSRENPRKFIMAGGADAVVRMFSERVKGRLREWITSEREGPQTWREALKSNGPALYVLIQKLFSDCIPAIPDDIFDGAPDDLKPTLEEMLPVPIALVRYCTGRPGLLTGNRTDIEKEESRWKTALDALKARDMATMNALRDAVKVQLNFVDQVKTGGIGISFPIEDIGIDILLANIAGIKPVGKTGDAADRVAEAIQDALVNGIAGQNLREEIEATLEVVGGEPKLAKELVELRRKLITKSMADQNFGVTPDMIPLLREIAGMLAARRTP